MLKLNQIAEDSANESVGWMRQSLTRLYDESPDFHDSIGGLSLSLGLLLYALEGNDYEIRTRFHAAALHLSLELAQRPPPEPATHRSPYEAELFINVIACFGSAEDRRRVATLQTWQYRNPVRAEHAAQSGYLELLCPYLGGAGLDLKRLGEVVMACGRTVACKEDKRFLAPSAKGLMALETGREAEWNYAMAQVLSAHTREAQSGYFKLLPEGLLCFRALMLAKLGMDRGWDAAANSEYLPLHLLDDGHAQ